MLNQPWPQSWFLHHSTRIAQVGLQQGQHLCVPGMWLTQVYCAKPFLPNVLQVLHPLKVCKSLQYGPWHQGFALRRERSTIGYSWKQAGKQWFYLQKVKTYCHMVQKGLGCGNTCAIKMNANKISVMASGRGLQFTVLRILVRNLQRGAFSLKMHRHVAQEGFTFATKEWRPWGGENNWTRQRSLEVRLP